MKKKGIFGVILWVAAMMLSLTSCFRATEVEDRPSVPEGQTSIQEVSVSVGFTGFGINVSAMSRAGEPTATIPANLNRIALSVFAEGRAEAVATTSQKREALGEGETFGSLTLRLPVGTYTFVAVLHEVPSDNLTLAPATITSPTLVSLPDKSIHDTYCRVQSQAITAGSSVTLDLGAPINAKFQLETLDEVPAEVTSIAVYVNTSASTTVPDQPTFNPTTGLATDNWKYVKNLTATPGQKFDRTFSILLSEDPASVGVKFSPQPTSATYPSRTLSEVPFQRAHITHATGNLFSLNPSFTFTFTDTPWTQDDITF